MSNIILTDFFARWCGLVTFHNIKSVPTFVIEKDGEIFKKYVGITSKNILSEDLNSIISKGEASTRRN